MVPVKSKLASRQTGETGSALFEAAVALPVFFTLVFTTLGFTVMFFNSLNMTDSLQTAGRIAVADEGQSTGKCRTQTERLFLKKFKERSIGMMPEHRKVSVKPTAIIVNNEIVPALNFSASVGIHFPLLDLFTGHDGDTPVLSATAVVPLEPGSLCSDF
jgi:hypothetical protein